MQVVCNMDNPWIWWIWWMIYIAYVGHVAVVPWYTLHLCDALCRATAPRCGRTCVECWAWARLCSDGEGCVVCLFSVFRLNKRPKGSSRVCWSHAIHRHGLHAEAISTLNITLKPKHPMGRWKLHGRTCSSLVATVDTKEFVFLKHNTTA